MTEAEENGYEIWNLGYDKTSISQGHTRDF